MFLGNINTIPSIVNLPGQGGAGPTPPPFQSTDRFLFDGNNGFLRSVTQTNYRFTDEISISCWVTFGDLILNPPAGSGFKNFMIVDQANSNFSQGYSLYVTRLGSGNALLRFQVGKGTATANNRAQIRIDNISGINSSKVFLIVASFLNSTNPGQNIVKVELKGVGVDLSNDKIPAPGPISYTLQANTFCIGNTSPVGSLEFDGSIDEVGVFNKRLIAADADAIFNWNQNGNLQAYSQANNLNLAAWYRMGENATFQPNSDPAKIGVWTMKNAVALNDTTKNLVSSQAADPNVGFLPENSEKQPGLPPPT